MFILLVPSVEPDTREVAAYENRRASRLEPVERSPRFASTGRRLKNDCHLSGSRVGEGSAEENVGTRCRGGGEETKKKKKKKRAAETRRDGTMISKRRRITCRGGSTPPTNVGKSAHPFLLRANMMYRGTRDNRFCPDTREK